jgi:hypothetical protein
MFVVAVVPYVHQLTNSLDRLVAWMERKHFIFPLEELSPDLPWMEGWPGRGVFNDIHHRVEPALREEFDVCACESLNHLSYAMRKAISDYTSSITRVLLVVEWLEKSQVTGWKLIAAPAHYHWVYSQYFYGIPRDRPAAGIIPHVINMYVALANLLIGYSWIVRRLRPTVKAEQYLIAVDAVSNVERDLLLGANVEPSAALVVHRNSRTAAALGEAFKGYKTCLPRDARVEFRTGARILFSLTRDIVLLWLHYAKRDPALFGRFVMLAVKRAMFSAFFSRYQPRFFWCRDDYSMDHIVRNVELRRIGGRSIGVAHGLPIDTYNANWREIDCDIYYGFGSHLYENFYKDVWPSHMAVKAVGSLRLTPQLRARMSADRPKDIVFFPIVHPAAGQILDEVFEIARVLNDRRVYIKFKPNRAATDIAEFEAAKNRAPANVEFIDPAFSPYELLLRTSYCIASGSTLAAESVQFGAKTFVFDIGNAFENFYFRNFAELTVRNAREVVARIHAIESGERDYDFSSLQSFVHQSKTDIYEVVKRDISGARAAFSER